MNVLLMERTIDLFLKPAQILNLFNSRSLAVWLSWNVI